MLMCYLRVCPFTKPIGQDCIVEKREDQCCPVITCPEVPVELVENGSSTGSSTELGMPDNYGCSIDNRFYAEGAQVPSNPNKPCELCYCIRNMTACVMQECTLHIDGCQPIYNKGVCCPVRYSCDHDADTPLQIDDHSTTTERPTTGFMITTPPAESQACIHDDEEYFDGSMIIMDDPCQHCYCMKGDIVCAVPECGLPLENEGRNCTAMKPKIGQCCPDTYICDGTELVTLEPESDSQVTEDLLQNILPFKTPVKGGEQPSIKDKVDNVNTLPTKPKDTKVDKSSEEESDEDMHHVLTTTESILKATSITYGDDESIEKEVTISSESEEDSENESNTTESSILIKRPESPVDEEVMIESMTTKLSETMTTVVPELAREEEITMENKTLSPLEEDFSEKTTISPIAEHQQPTTIKSIIYESEDEKSSIGQAHDSSENVEEQQTVKPVSDDEEKEFDPEIPTRLGDSGEDKTEKPFSVEKEKSTEKTDSEAVTTAPATNEEKDMVTVAAGIIEDEEKVTIKSVIDDVEEKVTIESLLDDVEEKVTIKSLTDDVEEKVTIKSLIDDVEENVTVKSPMEDDFEKVTVESIDDDDQITIKPITPIESEIEAETSSPDIIVTKPQIELELTTQSAESQETGMDKDVEKTTDENDEGLSEDKPTTQISIADKKPTKQDLDSSENQQTTVKPDTKADEIDEEDTLASLVPSSEDEDEKTTESAVYHGKRTTVKSILSASDEEESPVDEQTTVSPTFDSKTEIPPRVSESGEDHQSVKPVLLDEDKQSTEKDVPQATTTQISSIEDNVTIKSNTETATETSFVKSDSDDLELIPKEIVTILPEMPTDDEMPEAVTMSQSPIESDSHTVDETTIESILIDEQKVTVSSVGQAHDSSENVEEQQTVKPVSDDEEKEFDPEIPTRLGDSGEDKTENPFSVEKEKSTEKTDSEAVTTAPATNEEKDMVTVAAGIIEDEEKVTIKSVIDDVEEKVTIESLLDDVEEKVTIKSVTDDVEEKVTIKSLIDDVEENVTVKSPMEDDFEKVTVESIDDDDQITIKPITPIESEIEAETSSPDIIVTEPQIELELTTQSAESQETGMDKDVEKTTDENEEGLSEDKPTTQISIADKKPTKQDLDSSENQQTTVKPDIKADEIDEEDTLASLVPSSENEDEKTTESAGHHDILTTVKSILSESDEEESSGDEQTTVSPTFDSKTEIPTRVSESEFEENQHSVTSIPLEIEKEIKTAAPVKSGESEEDNQTMNSVSTDKDQEFQTVRPQQESDEMNTIIPDRTTVTQTISQPDNDSDEKTEITTITPSNQLPSRIPGEGDCLFNGITYSNNALVPTANEKCLDSCVCFNSIVRCKSTCDLDLDEDDDVTEKSTSNEEETSAVVEEVTQSEEEFPAIIKEIKPTEAPISDDKTEKNEIDYSDKQTVRPDVNAPLQPESYEKVTEITTKLDTEFSTEENLVDTDEEKNDSDDGIKITTSRPAIDHSTVSEKSDDVTEKSVDLDELTEVATPVLPQEEMITSKPLETDSHVKYDEVDEEGLFTTSKYSEVSPTNTLGERIDTDENEEEEEVTVKYAQKPEFTTILPVKSFMTTQKSALEDVAIVTSVESLTDKSDSSVTTIKSVLLENEPTDKDYVEKSTETIKTDEDNEKNRVLSTERVATDISEVTESIDIATEKSLSDEENLTTIDNLLNEVTTTKYYEKSDEIEKSTEKAADNKKDDEKSSVTEIVDLLTTKPEIEKTDGDESLEKPAEESDETTSKKSDESYEEVATEKIQDTTAQIDADKLLHSSEKPSQPDIPVRPIEDSIIMDKNEPSTTEKIESVTTIFDSNEVNPTEKSDKSDESAKESTDEATEHTNNVLQTTAEAMTVKPVFETENDLSSERLPSAIVTEQKEEELVTEADLLESTTNSQEQLDVVTEKQTDTNTDDKKPAVTVTSVYEDEEEIQTSEVPHSIDSVDQVTEDTTDNAHIDITEKPHIKKPEIAVIHDDEADAPTTKVTNISNAEDENLELVTLQPTVTRVSSDDEELSTITSTIKPVDSEEKTTSKQDDIKSVVTSKPIESEQDVTIKSVDMDESVTIKEHSDEMATTKKSEIEEAETNKPNDSETIATTSPITMNETSTLSSVEIEDTTTNKSENVDESATIISTEIDDEIKPVDSEEPSTINPIDSEESATIKPVTLHQTSTMKIFNSEDATITSDDNEEFATVKSVDIVESATNKPVSTNEITTVNYQDFDEVATTKLVSSEETATNKPIYSENVSTLKSVDSQEETTITSENGDQSSTPVVHTSDSNEVFTSKPAGINEPTTDKSLDNEKVTTLKSIDIEDVATVETVIMDEISTLKSEESEEAITNKSEEDITNKSEEADESATAKPVDSEVSATSKPDHSVETVTSNLADGEEGPATKPIETEEISTNEKEHIAEVATIKPVLMDDDQIDDDASTIKPVESEADTEAAAGTNKPTDRDESTSKPVDTKDEEIMTKKPNASNEIVTTKADESIDISTTMSIDTDDKFATNKPAVNVDERFDSEETTSSPDQPTTHKTESHTTSIESEDDKSVESDDKTQKPSSNDSEEDSQKPIDHDHDVQVPQHPMEEYFPTRKPDKQPPSSGYPSPPSYPAYGDYTEDEEEDPAQFGPGTCRYGGKLYVSAQQIPRDDPCDFCFCFRSDIICLQQSCPPPISGCHEEPISGFCCPRYECHVGMATVMNITTSTTTTTTTLPPHFLSHSYKGAATKRGCQIQGKAYAVGEEVLASSGPCMRCVCGGDAQMKCEPKSCSPAPMLQQMIASAAQRRRR
ncbi:unnamed protein product [Diamesa tonsa]